MRRCLSFLLFFGLFVAVHAQFPYGTTGLLHMPSAEMQKDKTVMLGGNFLNKENVPATWWGHNTYNYFINITILPCLEVAYVCTLVKGKEGDYWPKSTWGKFRNQDRYFSVRLRAIKEGQFSKYMPAVVFGANDALTKMWEGGASSLSATGATSNGFFSRFYIAASKHEVIQGMGELGLHLAYLYNKKEEMHVNGPAVGLSFKPEFHKELKLIVEYDNISVNGGFLYSIWKDRFNVLFEMQKFKYPTAGVVFKVHLK
jgi:hypothetical protein